MWFYANYWRTTLSLSSKGHFCSQPVATDLQIMPYDINLARGGGETLSEMAVKNSISANGHSAANVTKLCYQPPASNTISQRFFFSACQHVPTPWFSSPVAMSVCTATSSHTRSYPASPRLFNTTHSIEAASSPSLALSQQRPPSGCATVCRENCNELEKMCTLRGLSSLLEASKHKTRLSIESQDDWSPFFL